MSSDILYPFPDILRRNLGHEDDADINGNALAKYDMVARAPSCYLHFIGAKKITGLMVN